PSITLETVVQPRPPAPTTPGWASPIRMPAAGTARAADPPLRDLAAAQGKVIGTAVTGSMKWDPVE
ncbi:hypothetical protein ACWDU8_14165, partial [Streptomyces sp. NPDC003388]